MKAGEHGATKEPVLIETLGGNGQGLCQGWQDLFYIITDEKVKNRPSGDPKRILPFSVWRDRCGYSGLRSGLRRVR